jgi:hypothetical protein
VVTKIRLRSIVCFSCSLLRPAESQCRQRGVHVAENKPRRAARGVAKWVPPRWSTQSEAGGNASGNLRARIAACWETGDPDEEYGERLPRKHGEISFLIPGSLGRLPEAGARTERDRNDVARKGGAGTSERFGNGAQKSFSGARASTDSGAGCGR